MIIDIKPFKELGILIGTLIPLSLDGRVSITKAGPEEPITIYKCIFIEDETGFEHFAFIPSSHVIDEAVNKYTLGEKEIRIQLKHTCVIKHDDNGKVYFENVLHTMDTCPVVLTRMLDEMY